MNLTPIFISLKLALFTVLILLIIAVPIAYLLSFKKFRLKGLIETIFILPMVLPPSVLGFYFIFFLGPNTSMGRHFESIFGQNLVFSFEGILLASVIYSFPFMLNPILNAFRSIPKNIIESAQLMPQSKWNVLRKIYLPLSKRGLISGITMSFAHTLGAFGIILIVGGGMPETQTASIAIFEEMQMLNSNNAHTYSIILIAISFALILTTHLINKRSIENH